MCTIFAKNTPTFISDVFFLLTYCHYKTLKTASCVNTRYDSSIKQLMCRRTKCHKRCFNKNSKKEDRDH